MDSSTEETKVKRKNSIRFQWQLKGTWRLKKFMENDFYSLPDLSWTPILPRNPGKVIVCRSLTDFSFSI